MDGRTGCGVNSSGVSFSGVSSGSQSSSGRSGDCGEDEYGLVFESNSLMTYGQRSFGGIGGGRDDGGGDADAFARMATNSVMCRFKVV